MAKGIQKKQRSGNLLEPSQAPRRLELEGTLAAILSDFSFNAGMSYTTIKTWIFRCPLPNFFFFFFINFFFLICGGFCHAQFLSLMIYMDSADPGITMHKEVSVLNGLMLPKCIFN